MIKKLFYVIIILCMALLGAAFSVQNGHGVTFNYYVGTIDLPLSVIMVASFAVGVLLAIIAGSFSMVKMRIKLSSANRKYRQLEGDHQIKIKSLSECQQQAKREKAMQEMEALPEIID